MSTPDAEDVLVLAPFFDMPVRDAQKLFGMSEAAFVRAFRFAGVPRWPYRRVYALLQAAERLAQPADAAAPAVEHARALLLHEHDFMLRNPELLSLTATQTQGRSSCTVLPLTVNSPPFAGPVTATQLSAMKAANEAPTTSARRKRDVGATSSSATIGTASTSSRQRRHTAPAEFEMDEGKVYPPPLMCTLAHQHDPLCFANRDLPSSAIVLRPLVVQSRITGFNK